MRADFFKGRRVWLSGHTGFKGAWLSHWLLRMGADVHGYALAPRPDQPLFGALDLVARMRSEFGDVRDEARVQASVERCSPDVIFHLAAQPLVRLSYEIPRETFEVNVLGTVNVLEALRRLPGRCAAVMVTSDKCYENSENGRAFVETDPMGGHDPYSASKGMAELAIASYGRAFFPSDGPVALAAARAGNVIGGGDFSPDRIVPDCVRAIRAGRPLVVRNRRATRPWQHVLEPLAGYLRLATALGGDDVRLGLACRGGFNFGPLEDSARPVEDVVRAFFRTWPGDWEDRTDPAAPHEAGRLQLEVGKARSTLGWEPVWDFETTVARTANWYRAFDQGDSAQKLCEVDLEAYLDAAGRRAHGQVG